MQHMRERNRRNYSADHVSQRNKMASLAFEPFEAPAFLALAIIVSADVIASAIDNVRMFNAFPFAEMPEDQPLNETEHYAAHSGYSAPALTMRFPSVP